MDELIEGATYRVRFRTQGGNYRWYEREFVGVYVGREGSGRLSHALLFSLRPVAGTTDLHEHDIVKVERVPNGTKISRPRKVA